jgi:hypothetical protein
MDKFVQEPPIRQNYEGIDTGTERQSLLFQWKACGNREYQEFYSGLFKPELSFRQKPGQSGQEPSNKRG